MPAADRSLRLVNPLEIPAWDAQIARFSNATFFHSAAWTRVLCDAYRFRPVFMVEGENDALTGVLPLMEVDSWLTGRRGISLPFTDHCETLTSDAGTEARLFRSAVDHGTARRWNHIELRGDASHLGAPPSVSFHGHSLPLERNTAAMFARCASSTRRAVRKAELSGVTIGIAHDLDALRTFHRLLCKTRQRHGLPPQPFRFFASLHRHVLAQKLGCVILARQGDTAIAGAVFLHSGDTALFKFGASDDAFLHLRPNNLVLWHAIEWHARAGFRSLDFGRTSVTNPGLRQFKLSWGATERLITYARFDLRTAAFVTSADRSSGWHSHLFRHLPRAIGRLVGAAAYKHVA